VSGGEAGHNNDSAPSRRAGLERARLKPRCGNIRHEMIKRRSRWSGVSTAPRTGSTLSWSFWWLGWWSWSLSGSSQWGFQISQLHEWIRVVW